MEDELTKIVKLLRNQNGDVQLAARALVAKMLYEKRIFEMSTPGPVIIGDQRQPARSRPAIGRRVNDRVE